MLQSSFTSHNFIRSINTHQKAKQYLEPNCLTNKQFLLNSVLEAKFI